MTHYHIDGTGRKNGEPSSSSQSGDGGFTNPRVFDTIEEAAAAATSEDDYLDGLDQPEGDEDEQA